MQENDKILIKKIEELNKEYIETGYYSGEQCIEGDAGLLPSNIRKGVSIFNVVGIYEGSQSSAEQILFQCDDSATEESIISEYGSIIQVNNSSPASFGNLSNFEDKTANSANSQEVSSVTLTL